MAEDVRVSILIPNLNSPVLDEVLMSLMDQEGIEETEIIIVGIDKYQFHLKYPAVNFQSTPQPTAPAKARNIGVSLSTGEIIIFLDADCIVSSQWLVNILKNFDDPETSVVGGGVAFCQDNFITLCDNIATFHEYISSLPRGQKEQLPSLNLAMRREVIDKVGLFNEAYPYPAGEDAEFTTRIRLNGFPLLFDPEAFIFHKPQRRHLKDLYEHAYRLGQFSIKVDPGYKNAVKSPFLLSHWLLATIFSPIMSLGVIAKMVFQEKISPRYWPTLPIVFLIKLFWCFGAAFTLRRRKKSLGNRYENSHCRTMF